MKFMKSLSIGLLFVTSVYTVTPASVITKQVAVSCWNFPKWTGVIVAQVFNRQDGTLWGETVLDCRGGSFYIYPMEQYAEIIVVALKDGMIRAECTASLSEASGTLYIPCPKHEQTIKVDVR